MTGRPSKNHSSEQAQKNQQDIIPAAPSPIVSDKQSDQQLRKITVSQEVSYSGPLPLASELQAYEAACPGLARDIADMSIREQAHRHKLETQGQGADIENLKQLIANEHTQKTRGQTLAFGVVCLITIVAAIGVCLGHAVVAAWLEGTTLLSLVALFLGNKINIGSSTEKSENSEE